MADPIERAGRTVAIVGAMIAAVVSLSSLVSSCDKQRSDRYVSFRAAVQAEDQHWRSLYDDYLSTFATEVAANPAARREKIVALYTMAQRKLPSFREFDVDPSEKKEAIGRLTTIQSGLLNSLDQQGLGDPELARQLARLSFSGKLQLEKPATAGASAPASAPQKSGIPVTRETVELTGQSATGWDVDLFWCDGSAGRENFRTAMEVGESLATPARIGRSIAPGVTLGRIRVRPAPENLQRGQGPARYRWVIADSSEGEGKAAVAIQQAVNNALGKPAFALGRSDSRPTRWYISAYVCPGSGASAPPLANPIDMPTSVPDASTVTAS